MATAVRERSPAEKVRPIAADLLALLAPACERLEIAGSLRRKMAWVGDIELVAIPRFDAGPSLFPDAPPALDALDALVGELVAAGTLGKRLDSTGRARFGPKFKALVFQSYAVDLFSVPRPSRWGVIFAIRTGPADYSHQLVTPQGQSCRDGEGARRPGKLPIGMTVHDGQLFRGETPIDTYEEEAFLAAIGEELLPPEARR